jgi:hypothetical protein
MYFYKPIYNSVVVVVYVIPCFIFYNTFYILILKMYLKNYYKQKYKKKSKIANLTAKFFWGIHFTIEHNLMFELGIISSFIYNNFYGDFKK